MLLPCYSWRAQHSYHLMMLCCVLLSTAGATGRPPPSSCLQGFCVVHAMMMPGRVILWQRFAVLRFKASSCVSARSLLLLRPRTLL